MYKYEEMKKEVFTEEGYNMIERIKTNMIGRNYFNTMDLIKNVSGDSWMMLACIDWMIENKEIEIINNEGSKNYWTYRRKV